MHLPVSKPAGSSLVRWIFSNFTNGNECYLRQRITLYNKGIPLHVEFWWIIFLAYSLFISMACRLIHIFPTWENHEIWPMWTMLKTEFFVSYGAER